MKRGPTDYPAAPRLARWLLALRVPRELREFVLGDLDEGFAARRHEDGALSAHLWYWKQLTSVLGTNWPAASREPRETAAPQPFRALATDVRFVLRSLRRAPLFSALIVLTLMVGIGATSAVFSVVYPVVLAEPPYPDVDRLVMVWERGPNGEKDRVGWLTVYDIREETKAFESIALTASWNPIVRAGDNVEQIQGARVSHEYFRTLGVRPALGMDFAPEDDTPETRRVVLLSHGLWARQFGGDSSVVGKTMSVNSVTYFVSGVMPEGFRDVLSPEAEIWSVLGYAAPQAFACRTCRHLRAVARVRDGTTLTAATHEVDAFARTLKSRFPDQYGSVGALLPTLHSDVTGDVRAPLLGLFAAVGLLLALACANVANLFLSRTGERQTDLAIRLALGAKRSRLVRLVALEAGVLSLVGGALGLATAWFGTGVLLKVMSVPAVLANRVEMSMLIVGFALAITTVTAVAGATIPAMLALGEAALADLRVSGRAIVGRARHRMRNAVVVAEVALAVLLLAAAGLQVRSLQRALSMETGFEPSRVFTMQLSLTGQRYETDGEGWNYYRRLIDETAALPGVEGTAIVSQLPLGGNFDSYGVHREDKPSANPELDPSAQRFAVSAGYLDVMGIRVLRGRGFNAGDREGAGRVVLINEAGAKRIFGEDDPIGKRFATGARDTIWRTVVGIVENVRHLSLEGEPEPQMYLPFDQNMFEEFGFALVVRASGSHTALTRPIVRVARGLDGGVAISGARTMDDVIARVAAPRRLAATLVSGFAIIAVVLALGGLYGVMASSVAERIREMGLRAALGATPWSLVRLVVGRGIMLTAIGTSIGVSAFAASYGVVNRFLFGVSPSDPVTLASVAALLGTMALVACVVPAARAARVDPLKALQD